MELVPLTDADTTRALAKRVYDDPETLRYGGYTPGSRYASMTDLWVDRQATDWDVYAVRHEGQDAGIAGMSRPGENDHVATVALYLLVRGHGLGAATLDALVEHARKAGAKAVDAVVRVDNQASRALFEKAGFKKVGPSGRSWACASGYDWLDYELGL